MPVGKQKGSGLHTSIQTMVLQLGGSLAGFVYVSVYVCVSCGDSMLGLEHKTSIHLLVLCPILRCGVAWFHPIYAVLLSGLGLPFFVA